jgi:hypothetical protein
MDVGVARNIAHGSHFGQTTRHGSPMSEHIERVAAAVPEDARAVAFLHDVLEKTDTRVEELQVSGLTPVERAALDLLTRREGETFELHLLRVAHAQGPGAPMARAIKLADLEDHLAEKSQSLDSPPWGWARRHILAAQARLRDEPHAQAAAPAPPR